MSLAKFSIRNPVLINLIMITILRLGDAAYGVPICKDIQKRTGKKVTLGSLWVSMDQLAKKGMVEKRFADPTPRRGGRSKIYYHVTKVGLEALEDVKEFQQTIWQGTAALIKKSGGSA